MCENTSSSDMPGVLADERLSSDEDVMTVNIFNNNEDVDRLKSRLREIQFSDSEKGETRLSSGPECDHTHENVVNCIHFEGEGHLQTSETTSITSESLCISTETLIDHVEPDMVNSVDSPVQLNDMTHNSNSDSNIDTMVSNSLPQDTVNNGVAVTTANVSSGLLISPASLTQDVHVQMGNDNKRMSSVLESLDLQLLYIPKTQQLVAQKKLDQQSGSHVNNENPVIVVKENDIVIQDPASARANVLRNDNFSSQQSSKRNSPIKMAKSDTSSLQGVQILNPGCLDDSSSIGETEFLIRSKEPDQLTCDSADFVCNFPRINTNESLLRTFTDASSLSSLSTGTDFSISAASLDDGEGTGHCIDTGDAGFMEINLHSRNSFERSKNPSQDSGFEDKSFKPLSKRKGLSAFLSRNLFSRKSKESTNSNSDGEENQPGWKLFGKIPPKQGPVRDPGQIEVEYKEKQREDQLAASRAKKEDIEVLSTTALILENRPMNLPLKDPEEIEKHRKEYEAMVAAAKRKEQKELKLKKKQKQQQIRQEEQLLAASRVWTKDILPNWDAMKTSKKARDLWWHGIPTNVRGKVWKLAFGNDLNITEELYEICVSRAAERIKQMDESSVFFGTTETLSEPPSSKESSVELIKLDVSRTFPQLCIFQKGGPYHDLLHSLLGAYACYRPDIGYVQGMSFIAAVLLLNMEVSDAFICFANLLNRPCQVAFFRVDESLMKVYFQTYEEFFIHNLPSLHSHLTKQNLTPDIYLYDWIFTLYTKSLPLDIACRVWDVFCRDGEEFLFRTALGILQYHEEVLMNMDFIHLAQFLTKLPDCDSDFLFRSIDMIQMTIDKRKFTHVLASNREFRDNT